jgi:hypothetical protein
MAVYIYARHVTCLQLGCGGAPDIRLEGDIVRKIPRELQNVAEYGGAGAGNAQLHHFISETVAGGDAQRTKVVFGNLHLSGEAIIPYTGLYLQPGLPTRIQSDGLAVSMDESGWRNNRRKLAPLLLLLLYWW